MAVFPVVPFDGEAAQGTPAGSVGAVGVDQVPAVAEPVVAVAADFRRWVRRARTAESRARGVGEGVTVDGGPFQPGEVSEVLRPRVSAIRQATTPRPKEM